MRFGLVHRIMTDALAVLGVLAVVSTATLGLPTNVALVVGLALALAVPEGWQTEPFFRHAATTGMLLLFVVQSARIVAGQPPIDVAVEFAALLQVVRVATRRGAAHDQQIIVLALLHFVAGTVLGGGLTYGLCFLGFLIVAPGALVLSHLRREVEGNYRQGARDRTGLPVDVPRILRSRRVVGRGFLLSTCLISVPIFLFTAVLFVLFPRVGISIFLMNHPHTGRMVGFSDHVDLGQVGTLRSDPSVALRFEPPSLPDPPPPRLTLRLRGTALDAYDGHAWSRTSSERRIADHSSGGAVYPIVRAPRPGDTKYSFDVEPIDPPVIFLPPNAVAVQLRAQPQTLMADPLLLQKGAEGELRYGGGESRGIRYDVYVAPASERIWEPLSTSERARYTASTGLPPRAKALALSWTTTEATPLEKAKAIEQHLRNDYAYDLSSPSGGTASPVDHFLFESRRGHCEFFSTSMALLLREIGIPSRNVTGFVGGTYNRFGNYYAVREGDAHSWVEAYIDDPESGQGSWVTFDPTPASGAQPLGETTGTFVYVRDLVEAMSQRWNAYVVNYDMNQQLRLADNASRWYDSKRRGAGLDKGMLGKLTRGPVVAGALVLLVAIAYVAWQRRLRRKVAPKETKAKAATERSLVAAASLYRALENALSLHGLTRLPSTPPLRFAEQLRDRKHPLAPEVVELTGIYLGVRFGREALDDDAAKRFENRVKAIRSWEPAQKSA